MYSVRQYRCFFLSLLQSIKWLIHFYFAEWQSYLPRPKSYRRNWNLVLQIRKIATRPFKQVSENFTWPAEETRCPGQLGSPYCPTLYNNSLLVHSLSGLARAGHSAQSWRLYSAARLGYHKANVIDPIPNTFIVFWHWAHQSFSLFGWGDSSVS